MYRYVSVCISNKSFFKANASIACYCVVMVNKYMNTYIYTYIHAYIHTSMHTYKIYTSHTSICIIYHVQTNNDKYLFGFTISEILQRLSPMYHVSVLAHAWF